MHMAMDETGLRYGRTYDATHGRNLGRVAFHARPEDVPAEPSGRELGRVVARRVPSSMPPLPKTIPEPIVRSGLVS